MTTEVCIPGGLVPLRVYSVKNRCAIIRLNVWLYHKLGFKILSGKFELK